MELAVAVPWALLTWLVSVLGFLCLRPLWASWADQGYGIARVVGPLLVGCAIWLVVGNAAVPLSATAALLACIALALVATAVTWRHRHAPFPAWRRLLSIDVVWIASLCAFGLIRAWSPSIAGAERPMDHALLAALLQQQVVPPTDPWLAGFPVNYHYVGHALWTPLGLLSGQPPWVVYNLVLMTLPAQTLVAAWSLGRRVQAGWAWTGAAAMVLTGPVAVALDAARYWRVPGPQATTRVIPDTINEFPFFSLTWGDLHAHVIALPLLVGVAGVLLRLDEHVQDQPRRALVVPTTMLMALLGSAAVLTSTWDAVPMAIAAACTALLLARAPSAVGVAALIGGVVTVALMTLPVFLSFRPPPVASGLEWHGSPLGPFLLVQGGWLLPAGLLCLAHERRGPLVATAILVAAAAWLAPGMAVRALILALGLGIWRQREVLGRGATALTLAALAMLLIAECLWVDDIYGWRYRRMNTVFKWQLHAIVLLTLAWPRLLALLWSHGSRHKRDLQMLVRCALVGLASVSAASTLLVLAARSREREPVRTLNGLAGLTRTHAGDAAAIEHLWKHGAPQDVVLEAVGQSYSYGARISAMTGHPALLGWRGHEQLWRRGRGWQRVIDERARLVDDLYAGPTEGLQTRLQAAGVRYVVIGAVERRRYPALAADRFSGVADAVSDTGGTVLLRVR